MDAKYMEIEGKLSSVDPFDVPAYSKALQLIAGESKRDFLDWQSKQMELHLAAIKPPTAAEIVSALIKTDFTNNTSIDDFTSLLWAGHAPYIPLATGPNLHLALRPSVYVLDVALDAPLSDESQKDFDHSTQQPPTRHPYLTALRPSFPSDPKRPEPPAIVFQPGKLIVATESTPTPKDWSVTDFILLLNAADSSVWTALDYAPFDADGERVPIALPKTMDPTSPPRATFPGLPDEKPFDVAMVLGSEAVKKWDLSRLQSAEFVVQTVVASRSSRGLVARMAEPEDFVAAKLEVLRVREKESLVGKEKEEGKLGVSKGGVGL